MENSIRPRSELLSPGRELYFMVTQLRHNHYEEGRNQTGSEEAESTAKGRRRQCSIALVHITGVYCLYWLVRQHEARYNEKYMHHRSAREDNSEKWQLDKPRRDILVDAIGSCELRCVVLRVVAEKNKDRGDAAKTVKVRCGVNLPCRFVCWIENVGDEAWKQQPHQRLESGRILPCHGGHCCASQREEVGRPILQRMDNGLRSPGGEEDN